MAQRDFPQRQPADARAPEIPLDAGRDTCRPQACMESPSEVLSHISPVYEALGGIAGLLWLAKRLATFPLEISVREERLRAEAAEWERKRTDEELLTLQNYAEAFEIRQEGRPVPSIELSEE